MTEKRNNRSGVALIIVLGLVAVLLIVSVAFTINMRVERAGAANLRHAAVARQVVKGAMAAAIAAIDEEIGDDMAPQWYATNSPSDFVYERKYVDAHNKPVTRTQWKNTYVSYDPSNLEHVDANFFTPEVASYFPSGASYKGYATKYVASGSTTKEVDLPEWLPVYADAGNKDVMGRYAFFVLDTSGLLDASCVNRTNRWMGRDPAEIHLAPALFSGEVLNAETLAANMVADGRYDSFAEFAARNESGKTQPIKDTHSFSTFSYEPSPTNALVYIGGNAASLRRDKKKIIAAFYDSGLTAGESFGAKDCEQARWAYLGLVDFVDGDGEMEKDDKVNPWERPVTENLPIMSGFVAKFTIEAEEEIKESGKVGTSEETAWAPAGTCRIRAGAAFTIPFVFPFVTVNNYKDVSGLAVKASADVNFERVDNKDLKAVFTDLRKKFEKIGEVKGECGGHKGDNYVIIATTNDWKTGIALSSDAPPKLCAGKGTDLLFQVAGSTYVGSDVQHRWPITGEYDDPGAESWMTVPYGAQDESLDFGEPTEVDATDADGNKVRNAAGSTFKVRKWSASAVIWAEFVDPKFACRDMRESDMSYTENGYMYYRASHLSPKKIYKRQNAFEIPITELTTDNLTKNYFNPSATDAFKGADKVEPFADDDEDGYGDYFDGSKSRNAKTTKNAPQGSGPVSSYILTHPGVAGRLYHMNMDGVRNAPDDTSKNADDASLQWRSYVKNEPLESVGELGYLPIGIWQTIRLYDYGDDAVDFKSFSPNKNKDLVKRMTQFNHLPGDDSGDKPYYHPVLDYFTVSETIPPGRINLNTLNKSVLASAFHRLPIATEKGASPIASGDKKYCVDLDESGNPTGTDSLKLFAEALLAFREDPEEDGRFSSLSDLGKIFLYGGDGDNMFHGNMGYAAEGVFNAAREKDANYGEFERESVIRNSCGLFTTRGQTFIIAVRGESYSPMFGKTSVKGGSVNAAKTAVAQVWRDSEPDENGNHPIFIQFFKIIDD